MEKEWDTVEAKTPQPHPSWWISLEGGPKDGRRVEVGAELPATYIWPMPTPPPGLTPRGYMQYRYTPTERRNKHGDLIYIYEGTDVAD